ncbi:hypothetical protein CBFG_02073 [Clostridiales bacterium 1_7_47FAA]|nr:hypothetical protein CBFG_02073 [Clostridiales bacterium 1_7_47FAA]
MLLLFLKQYFVDGSVLLHIRLLLIVETHYTAAAMSLQVLYIGCFCGIIKVGNIGGYDDFIQRAGGWVFFCPVRCSQYYAFVRLSGIIGDDNIGRTGGNHQWSYYIERQASGTWTC